MSFSWQRGPQWNSIYEWGLLDCVSVCVGQDLALYLARTRDIESDGKGRWVWGQARCHSCWGIIRPIYWFPIIEP